MKRPNPSVSLCMIVRDEEAFLPACLDAARPFVDEICIVDTGSTDGTIAIAKARGARVQSITWPESFAEARNHSLEMASGDWILVLDADEVLRPESGGALRMAICEQGLAGAFVEVVSELERGRESVHLLRLFRNAPEHRYVGLIHEQVSPAVQRSAQRNGQALAVRDLTVEHHGYTSSVQQARCKQQRNRRLFELATQREPDNAYTWFKYADFLRGVEPAAAPAAFERARGLIEALEPDELRSLSYCGEVYALFALCELQAGRAEHAGQLLEQANQSCSSTPHLEFVTGSWALATGRPQRAERAFASCRQMHGKPQVQSASTEVTGERSALGIVRAMLDSQRAGEALAHLVRERRLLPESRLLARWQARLLGDLERWDDSLSVCRQWLASHPGDALFLRIATEIALEAARLEEATSWAAQSRELPDGGGVDGACLRGQVALASGDFEAAERELGAATEDVIAEAGLALLELDRATRGDGPGGEAAAPPSAPGKPVNRTALGLVARRVAACEALDS